MFRNQFYLGGKKKKKLFSGFILHKIKHINRSQIYIYIPK